MPEGNTGIWSSTRNWIYKKITSSAPERIQNESTRWLGDKLSLISTDQEKDNQLSEPIQSSELQAEAHISHIPPQVTRQINPDEAVRNAVERISAQAICIDASANNKEEVAQRKFGNLQYVWPSVFAMRLLSMMSRDINSKQINQRIEAINSLDEFFARISDHLSDSEEVREGLKAYDYKIISGFQDQIAVVRSQIQSLKDEFLQIKEFYTLQEHLEEAVSELNTMISAAKTTEYRAATLATGLNWSVMRDASLVETLQGYNKNNVLFHDMAECMKKQLGSIATLPGCILTLSHTASTDKNYTQNERDKVGEFLKKLSTYYKQRIDELEPEIDERYRLEDDSKKRVTPHDQNNEQRESSAAGEAIGSRTTDNDSSKEKQLTSALSETEKALTTAEANSLDRFCQAFNVEESNKLQCQDGADKYCSNIYKIGDKLSSCVYGSVRQQESRDRLFKYVQYNLLYPYALGCYYDLQCARLSEDIADMAKKAGSVGAINIASLTYLANAYILSTRVMHVFANERAQVFNQFMDNFNHFKKAYGKLDPTSSSFYQLNIKARQMAFPRYSITQKATNLGNISTQIVEYIRKYQDPYYIKKELSELEGTIRRLKKDYLPEAAELDPSLNEFSEAQDRVLANGQTESEAHGYLWGVFQHFYNFLPSNGNKSSSHLGNGLFYDTREGGAANQPTVEDEEQERSCIINFWKRNANNGLELVKKDLPSYVKVQAPRSGNGQFFCDVDITKLNRCGLDQLKRDIKSTCDKHGLNKPNDIDLQAPSPVSKSMIDGSLREVSAIADNQQQEIRQIRQTGYNSDEDRKAAIHKAQTTFYSNLADVLATLTNYTLCQDYLLPKLLRNSSDNEESFSNLINHLVLLVQLIQNHEVSYDEKMDALIEGIPNLVSEVDAIAEFNKDEDKAKEMKDSLRGLVGNLQENSVERRETQPDCNSTTGSGSGEAQGTGTDPANSSDIANTPLDITQHAQTVTNDQLQGVKHNLSQSQYDEIKQAYETRLHKIKGVVEAVINSVTTFLEYKKVKLSSIRDDIKKSYHRFYPVRGLINQCLNDDGHINKDELAKYIKQIAQNPQMVSDLRNSVINYANQLKRVNSKDTYDKFQRLFIQSIKHGQYTIKKNGSVEIPNFQSELPNELIVDANCFLSDENKLATNSDASVRTQLTITELTTIWQYCCQVDVSQQVQQQLQTIQVPQQFNIEGSHVELGDQEKQQIKDQLQDWLSNNPQFVRDKMLANYCKNFAGESELSLDDTKAMAYQQVVQEKFKTIRKTVLETKKQQQNQAREYASPYVTNAEAGTGNVNEPATMARNNSYQSKQVDLKAILEDAKNAYELDFIGQNQNDEAKAKLAKKKDTYHSLQMVVDKHNTVSANNTVSAKQFIMTSFACMGKNWRTDPGKQKLSAGAQIASQAWKQLGNKGLSVQQNWAEVCPTLLKHYLKNKVWDKTQDSSQQATLFTDCIDHIVDEVYKSLLKNQGARNRLTEDQVQNPDQLKMNADVKRAMHIIGSVETLIDSAQDLGQNQNSLACQLFSQLANYDKIKKPRDVEQKADNLSGRPTGDQDFVDNRLDDFANSRPTNTT